MRNFSKGFLGLFIALVLALNYSTFAFASEVDTVFETMFNAHVFPGEDSADGVNSTLIDPKVDVYSFDKRSAQTRNSISGLGIGYDSRSVDVLFAGISTNLVKVEVYLIIVHRAPDSDFIYVSNHEFEFYGTGLYNQTRTFAYPDWSSAQFSAKAYFSDGSYQYLTSPRVVNN